MSAKPARKPKVEKEPSIFVPRARLANKVAMGQVTESRQEVLRLATVKRWNEAYEFKATDEVKAVLAEIDVAWSDKK